MATLSKNRKETNKKIGNRNGLQVRFKNKILCNGKTDVIRKSIQLVEEGKR